MALDKRLEVGHHSTKKTRQLMVAIMLIGYFLIGIVGYWGGVRSRDNIVGKMIGQNRQMQTELSQRENYKLKNQELLSKYQQDRLVDKETIELLRLENRDLLQDISELREEVIFYKRVVNPKKESKGLAIGRLELRPMTGENIYQFTIDLMQVTGRTKVQGRLYLTIIGMKSGKEVQLSLPEMNAQYNKKGITVNFYNYKSLQGEISLPKDFMPKRVEVKVKFVKGKRVTLSKAYFWEVK